MENFNPEKYRKNLKDALHTTRKVNPEKAEEILEEAKESIEYKEAEKHQSEKRTEKQEAFYHKNKIEAKSEEQLRKEIEDNYNQLQKVTGDKNPMDFEKNKIQETMRSGIENGMEAMEAIRNLDKQLNIIIYGAEKFKNDTSIFYKKTSEKSISGRTHKFEYGLYFDELKSVAFYDKGGLRERAYDSHERLYNLLEKVSSNFKKLIRITESSNIKSTELNDNLKDVHKLLGKTFIEVIRIYNCWNDIKEETREKYNGYRQLKGDVKTLTELIKDVEDMQKKHGITKVEIDTDPKIYTSFNDEE